MEFARPSNAVLELRLRMIDQNSEHQTSQTSLFRGSFFRSEAHLVLQDGSVFECQAIGHVQDVVTGEVVFHTGMSGYQEIMTDPSYAGQVVTFTYPHIGSYGVNKEDDESHKIFAAGMIMRDYVVGYSNHRAQMSLANWLKKHKVMGLTGLDTRALTRILRSKGSMPAAFGTGSVEELKKAAAAAKSTDGIDLVDTVTCDEQYTVGEGRRTIVAYDFGIKRSIINQLTKLGKVIVVPAKTPAKEVIKMKPDGVFLSNGPGDPSAVSYASKTIGELLGKVPIFGICLGHQLLCISLGASTKKLKFGHHGGNHPVKNLKTGAIEITSQNHNYEVDSRSIKGAEVSHINLNDQVVEGIYAPDSHAFSVQYHPEAGPGPHDATYLFDDFKKLMDDYAKAK